MLTKINKKEDGIIVKFLHSLQFILLCISALLLVFWLLEILNIHLNTSIRNFFFSVASLGGLVYGKVIQIGNYQVNFSFLSTIILFLVSCYFINFIIQFLRSLEVKAEKIKEKLNKSIEDEFNKGLEKEAIKEALKNNKFLILIDFKVESNKSSWEDDIKIITSKDVTSSFFALLEGNLECETEFADNKLLLIFNDFNVIDNNLQIMENLFRTLKKEYNEKRCNINWVVAIDTYKLMTEVGEKTERLKKLIELLIPDKYVCQATFKNRYDLHANSLYELQSKGFYNIKDSEEVFTLSKKTK